MAFDAVGIDLSLKAAADLSGQQYKFVKLDANGDVVIVAALTDRPIGILQNKPTSGQMATVRCFGVSKGSADSATVAAGDEIMSSADGQIADAGVGSFRVGLCLKGAAAAGEIAVVAIDCLPKSAAA